MYVVSFALSVTPDGPKASAFGLQAEDPGSILAYLITVFFIIQGYCINIGCL